MSGIIIDKDGILGESSGVLDSGGGYDLTEIKKAHEALSGHVGDEKGYEEVEPILITVIEGVKAVRTEEFEARSVIISYDQFDNIIEVELL